jgi:rhamnosyltransferase
MSKPEVAILLLTKNGAAFLKESLDAIFGQQSPYSFEVLALDSGSTDGTLALLSRYPVRIVAVEPAAFQHGRTRNLAATLASPGVEYLVYLTQDATPLPGWLDALVNTVATEDVVAGAFSRQVPRPGCNPLLARRIVEEWPQVGGGQRIVKQLNGPTVDSMDWHSLAHFADTSSCIRRAVWAQIPFPEVDFAEDLAWAGQVLKAGYSLVYEPGSAVLHSHSGSLARQFRENVDHRRGMGIVLAGETRRLMPAHHSALDRIARDVRAIWQRDEPVLRRLRWLAYAPLWYGASMGGQWVGAHVDRWPGWLRRRLSWQATVARGS